MATPIGLDAGELFCLPRPIEESEAPMAASQPAEVGGGQAWVLRADKDKG